MADDDASTNSEIEVDAAAAYFGATGSSDMLHSMMSLPRNEAMTLFFEYLSDIVLQPGDFDFEAASERMACEGGEIYYLVAGHLELMSLPDPLLNALGQPGSSGEVQGQKVTGMTAQQEQHLSSLADPMRMMKLFAVAHQTGKGEEVLKYLSALEGHLSHVEASMDALVSIDQELNAALDVAGHVLPVATLASGTASAATIALPPSPPKPTVQEAAQIQDVAEKTNEVPAIPLPKMSNTEPTSVVPLPDTSVALPNIEPVEAAPEAVNVESEKQVARATQDAFAGAFDLELAADAPVDAETQQEVAEPQQGLPEAIELAPQHEEEPEEEFVSAAEHFIAADEDGSGALSIEELAQATGSSLEEAEELHVEADTDGDGVVSLSEFIASPAAEKTASLPKPIAPVRKPLGPASKPVAQPPQPVNQRPQPLPNQQNWQQPPTQQPVPQQNWQQPPPQQPAQQGWPRQQAPLVQPTIRSGIHCRGCGIGLDPYWRFCPVCGQQNLGY
ncbi:MAG: hypothetical protein ISP83_03790 [Candidatus Poseidonia sp.]|nr:hypothetical protein [Poseidonia sp.]MBL6747725.1 hypothetical protein [Poseidonia sp.]MBL6806240.1 hypothetical protein [Poseidonia sp.]MBL6892435.1 hypothetical protein [Poseidonia sp.]